MVNPKFTLNKRDIFFNGTFKLVLEGLKIILLFGIFSFLSFFFFWIKSPSLNSFTEI